MEENKLFNQIKSAAENVETKDFPGMEKVWNRVEEKLDNKEDKKAIWRWKKIAVAASLLLLATLGYQFFKNNPNDIKPNEVITATDSIKKASPTTNTIVSTDSVNPAIKEDAEQILQKQIKPATQVVVESVADADYMLNSNTASPTTQGYFSAPVPAENEEYTFKTKKAEVKQVEMLMDKDAKVNNTQKEEPLVVIDNKAVKKSIKELEFTDGDSLIVLKEPLYIINGVEYTEQELFGPNPTSPYTPLNKQEIETLSILQDQKAVEQFGKKGSKGVVIITTKNGKPVSASKKAK